jgi:Ca2+-binding RTX toxin-like protein
MGAEGTDSLYGGQGNDFLYGSELKVGHFFTGPDYLDGGAGFDRVYYSASMIRGIIADLRQGTVSFRHNSEVGVERLVDIEGIESAAGWDRMIGNGAANLFIGGYGGDTLIGNFGADTLLGEEGWDRLVGGRGADILDGGSGRDILFGGDGDDLLTGGTGADRLYGGAGTDAVSVTGAYDASIVLRGRGSLQLDAGPLSTLLSIENVGTQRGDDTVVGSAANNFINVGEGNNRVYGLGGDDTIIGGLGNDILRGGAGDDRIYGEGASPGDELLGTDVLAGGAGNDILYTSLANLRLSGGSGDDVFVLNQTIDGRGQNRSYPVLITDFEQGDVIDLAYRFGPPKFIGQIGNPEDMDVYDVGFVRSGDDTAVRIRLLDDGSDEQFQEITLRGFQGSLTAENFDM